MVSVGGESFWVSDCKSDCFGGQGLEIPTNGEGTRQPYF